VGHTNNIEAMNILFVCTSNKDRSPALEKYFREKYPHHQYRSAGVNRFFTNKKNTHYLTETDIEWADMIVFAAKIHLQVVCRDFKPLTPSQAFLILDLGDYKPGEITDLYLRKAELIIKPFLG